MREILFRGKRKDNNKWIFGNLNFYPDINRAFIRITPKEMASKLGTLETEVKKDTVCQYTELLDREGNKVFENDVMKFTDEVGYDSDYFVEWRENKYIVVSAENSSAIDELDRFFCDNAVVVGNKFDWKPEA